MCICIYNINTIDDSYIKVVFIEMNTIRSMLTLVDSLNISLCYFFLFEIYFMQFLK